MRYKEQIIDLLNQGKTYSEIHLATGAAKGTISFHAQKLGLGKGKNLYKSRFCVKCNKEIPKETNRKRKYCLECKQTLYTGICDLCDKEVFGRNRCGACSAQVTRYKIKKRAVEYLGGKCMRCDGVFPVAVYDFHHKNPEEKEFGISHRGYSRTWGVIKLELDKCILLCANCHRLESNKTQVKIESLMGG